MNTKKVYTALHNHSHYSILDGYATIDEYIKAAVDNGMPGIGLCDHGSASGLYKFITQAQKAGITPVPGIEFYVAPENPEGAKAKYAIYYGEGGKRAPKYDISNGAYTHMTVFAYNNKGLENLFKLTSLSWHQEHFYFKPRIDTNMLAEYSEGLIVTTGCPSSEVSRRFLLGQDDKAYEYASRLKSIFGDNLYVEIMNHRMKDDELEEILVPKQIKLARDLDIKLIATNDSHYAFKCDAESHERVLAMQTKSFMDQPAFHEGGRRFAFSTEEYYIKTYDEMLELYPEEVAEEALDNTMEVMEKCKDIKLEYDSHLRPEIEIPEGFTEATYLQHLIYEGFKKKRGNQSKEIQEESVRRIQEEFQVIHSNDFISYFLVVHDYIDFAHKKGIGVGAGRGCFVPGTKVRATQGAMKNIEDIKVGDKVQTHDTSYQEVEDLFIYDVEDEDMTRITLSNGKVIESTSDHLIFDKQEGFKEAGDFKVGDIVLGPKENNNSGEIKKAHLKNKQGFFISHRQNKMKIEFNNSYEERMLNILETDSKVKAFKPQEGFISRLSVEVVNRNGDKYVIEVAEESVIANSLEKIKEVKKSLKSNGLNYQIWTESEIDNLDKELRQEIEVVAIEHYKYTGKVYDIQVANVHNYNVEGVTVHNSIGGSEIAYVLDISNTDPIRFDLLFERFLSPGRGSLYEITYDTGEKEEIAVSAKKKVYSGSGDNVVYVHELNPGDLVNYGNEKKIIHDIFVKVPGSAPDVDTDFHTEGREEVVQYCIDKYGEENVANIITFGTFQARKSFNAMSKIYGVPAAVSRKVSAKIDAPIKDLLDPSSPKYSLGVDFRNELESNPKLKEVAEYSVPLQGRISETGVHPCGVIISSKPLAGVIPTQVRQTDGKVITQWEYPELESLGLIKMDMLGLELIDTIQQTLENIRLVNESAKSEDEKREIPDMRKLINGGMDDKESYKNLQEGNTTGIFQLGSPGVKELLKRAKPEEFIDIAIITALYRPGPMKSGAHIQYADRKNGTEEASYIHKDFEGTVIEEILKPSYGLLVFQEQIMLIAGRYAGMTPYETDKLRSAIGKKKMDQMMKMKPKFFEGCRAQGASEEAIKVLWDTIEVFGEYGFNKSHSVSYAINIYQTIYLKTHYPSEFMAALIQQAFGGEKKTLQDYIQEARRMNLRLGPVDVNSSQIQMASTGIAKDRKYDIVFGFNAVSGVNDTLAQAIVEERNENGLYKSVADFVSRVSKRTSLTASPLSNLALAGAFDSLGVSRKLVDEKAKMFIDSSSKKVDKGVSLFDMMGTPQANVAESIEITGEDFDYVEMLKNESKVIGMFVSGHPIDNLGHIATKYRPKSIIEGLQQSHNSTFNVIATVTAMAVKTNRSGRMSIALLLDDGESTYSLYLNKELVEEFKKGEEIAKARENKNNVDYEIINNDSIKAREKIELNDVYVFKMKSTGWNNSVRMSILDIQKLNTAPDGSLPYEVKVDSNSLVKKVEEIAKSHKDENGATIKIHKVNGEKSFVKDKVKLSLDFIMQMEAALGKENILTKNI